MVKSIKVNSKGKKTNLYCIGDMHIGAKAFDKVSFAKLMKRIKEDEDALVLLMGDHCDLIVEEDTRRYVKDEVDPLNNTVEKQMDTLWDYIEPISDKVIGVLRGNHEASYSKYNADEFDKYRDFAEELAYLCDTDYLEDLGIIELSIGTKRKTYTYNIVAMHGAGGGTSMGSQINYLSKIVNNFEMSPHIALMGHVHALQTVISPRMNYKFKTKIKHLGLTGTFFKTYTEGDMNYSSSCNYAPLAIGCIMYELDNSGNIKDNKIIFD